MGAQLKEEFVTKFPNNDYFIFDLYLWFNEKLLNFIHNPAFVRTYYQMSYSDNDIDNHRIDLDIKFSLVSNPKLGESVQINVNN